MLNGLNENEVKLLSIIGRYVFTNRQANTKRIMHLMEINIPSLINCWEQAAGTLLEKDIIFYETDNLNERVYGITESGKETAAQIHQKNYLILFFYNEFYKRAEKSSAHSEFCRLVYGQNFCQHGMLDMNQLNKLIDAAELNNNSHVLELGCGNGFITEYISDKTQCKITGIDIAENAIEHAKIRTILKRDRLVFETGSMENLDYPDNSFDAIISIDTLYFVGNLKNVIQSVSRVLKPGGSMYIFYHVPPEVGNDPGSDPAKCSYLGKVLYDLDLKFLTIYFTKENRQHWELKKQVLEQLRTKFEEEGNMFLYNNRMEECMYNLGEFYRFLYIVENNKPVY